MCYLYYVNIFAYSSAIIKFKGIEINYPTYRLFIEKFTKHTYIMVVVKDSEISKSIN